MSSLLYKIEKEVEAKGLSIAEFAKQIGISRGGFYTLSEDSMKLSLLRKISTVLGLPISDFIEEPNEGRILKEPSSNYGNTLINQAQQLIKGIEILEKENRDLKKQLNLKMK